MTSLDPVLVVLSSGSLALGMAAAQSGGSLSLNWRSRVGAIHHRLRCLPRGAPKAGLRVAGTALVASLLAGGTLAAYAAAPSAPSPSSAPEPSAMRAADVVVSGGKPGPGVQTARGGRGVKASAAALVEGGAAAEVGRDPAGPVVLAMPAAPVATAGPAGLPAEATIQAYVDRDLARDPQALEQYLKADLTLEEARRLDAYWGMMTDEFTRRRAAGPSTGGISPAEQHGLLGDAAYADFVAVQSKELGSRMDSRMLTIMMPMKPPSALAQPAIP